MKGAMGRDFSQAQNSQKTTQFDGFRNDFVIFGRVGAALLADLCTARNMRSK
jgi:hypothetical protein